MALTVSSTVLFQVELTEEVVRELIRIEIEKLTGASRVESVETARQVRRAYLYIYIHTHVSIYIYYIYV